MGTSRRDPKGLLPDTETAERLRSWLRTTFTGDRGPVLQLPHAPKRGDSFELVVEKLTPDADGLAYLKAAIGPQHEERRFRFLIPKCVPGDKLRVSVTKRRGPEVRCRVDQLVTPSEARVTPRCAHFGFRTEPSTGCGGCCLQTLAYADQMKAKHAIVTSLFAEADLDSSVVRPIVGSEDPWFYRNKMEYSFAPDREGRVELGLRPSGYRYEVVDLRECFLQSTESVALVRVVVEWARQLGVRAFRARSGEGFLRQFTVREGKRTSQRMVELVTTHQTETETTAGLAAATAVADSLAAAVRACDVPVDTIYWTQHRAVRGERTRMIEHHLFGPETLTETLELAGGRRLNFEIHPRAFFQPNTLGAETLYTEVMAAAGLAEGSTHTSRTIYDLYCGTGTIGMCMAPYADRVVGVDLEEKAIENARRNAEHNGIENATFHAGDVGKVLARENITLAPADVVIVDPPRSGLIGIAIEQLVELQPCRLVYVSCNPKALIRDAAELLKRGYELNFVQPMDLFPHTRHMENVALFLR